MDDKKEKLMTVTEICEYLQVTRRTIERWRKNDNMPCLKFGGRPRFDKEKVLQWAKNNDKI